MLIPKGLAHGFLVLSETAEFSYKCDEFYHPEDEVGIRWDDPTIAIEWPKVESGPILSAKDQINPYWVK
jgi:dTDP-4-dehydrorhamnose 3,5-epimerase